MRSDAYRSTKYTAKTAPTTVGLKVAAQLSTMRTTFSAATNALVAKQLLTAAELDAAGVVGAIRGKYHAFSNRLYKITTEFSGATATNMAQIEHDKFEATCGSPTLVAIALNVYGLVVS